MKNIICFIFLGLCVTTYAQDIVEMNKKELKISLKRAVASKDSLTLLNNNKLSEISLLTELLNNVNDSIKTQKAKISALLLLKKECHKNNKILTREIIVLNDSITKMKANTSFLLTSFSLTTLPKNCCMVYSESKELYKSKEYICYWGEKELDTSLIFYLNNEKIILERIDTEDDEADNYCFSDKKYFVKIRKRKTLFENDIVLIKESAEIFIKNLMTGQEIVKNIYGEGGC